MNSYYAAGRVMVPALLDAFTVQAFFKRGPLLDLLTELAGTVDRGSGCLPFCLSVCVSSACVMPIRLSIVLKGRPPAYPLRGIVGD